MTGARSMLGGFQGRLGAARAILTVVALFASVVGTASAKVPKPTITGPTVSPSPVTTANGWVTLSATVSNASNCTFSAKPAVSGLPGALACSNGKLAKVIDLPVNSGKQAAKYKFTLSVAGPGGTKKAKFSTTVAVGAGGTPGNLSGVVSLASNGTGGYCALLASGGVDCWGAGPYGDVPVVIPGVGGTGTLSGAASVTSDGGGYCALLTSGGVDCWGEHESDVPVPLAAVGGNGTLAGVASVTSDVSGSYCALLTAGGVDCWGAGGNGELGNGADVSSSSPVAVLGVGGTGTLSGVANLTGGYEDYCAVLTSGGVDCWGFDAQGELGSGEETPEECSYSCSKSPVSVVGVGGTGTLSGVARVASTGDDGIAGSFCALFATGGVACWGWGASFNGEAGGTVAPVAMPGPAYVGSLSEVAILVGSGTNTGATGSYCAVLTTSGVNCWGWNQLGALGNGTSETAVHNPAEAPTVVVGIGGTGALSGVSSVTDGIDSYCALLTSGGVDCWGLNNNGNLGSGITEGPDACNNGPCSTAPAAVLGVGGTGTLSGATSVLSAGSSYCAILASGGVDCWGRNESGELGDGTSTASDVPVKTLAPL